VEGQHLADSARLAEGEEQVFGVVAVVQPGARQGGDGLVHRRDQRAFGEDVVADDVDSAFQGVVDLHAIRGQQDHVAEAAFQLVRQGRLDLDIVLGQHQRQRAAAGSALQAVEKT
jgi:hypothetical protein